MHEEYIRVEITLTGLGILALPLTADSRRGIFDDASFFLVDTVDGSWGLQRHWPLFTFRARDWVDGSLDSVKVEISERGEELVHVDLRNQDFTLESKSEGDKFHCRRTQYMERACDARGYPRRAKIPCPQDSLDWIPDLKEYQLMDEIDVEGSPAGVCTRVRLPPGTIRSLGVVPDRENEEQPQMWYFKKPDMKADGSKRKAVVWRPIANRLVFACELDPSDEEHARIKIGSAEINLKPADGKPLRLGITNLPADTRLQRPDNDEKAIHHMQWLAKLAQHPDEARKSMHLPHSVGGLHTIVGRICPFATYFYEKEAAADADGKGES